VFKLITYGYEPPVTDAGKASKQYTKNVWLQHPYILWFINHQEIKKKPPCLKIYTEYVTEQVNDMHVANISHFHMPVILVMAIKVKQVR
jgi:hypothetical protein